MRDSVQLRAANETGVNGLMRKNRVDEPSRVMGSNGPLTENDKRKSAWPGRAGKSVVLTIILGLVNDTVFQQGNFWYESLFLVFAFLLCLLLFSAIDGLAGQFRTRSAGPGNSSHKTSRHWNSP